MKFFFLFLILFCFATLKARAQGSYCPPDNIGFEKGNFTNWQCDTGSISDNGTIKVLPCGPVTDRQTLYNKSGYPLLDPYGKFPTLCPYGGGYSVRLGNHETGKGAERISYTFTIPANANQYDLIFYYAVVLQNPPHQSFQQPRFTVKTFDVTDNTYIPCSSFDFIASANLPGFKLAPAITAADTQVYYKDWTPATLALLGYAGKQIRLEFTTNDCTLGGHFGYAYLDVNEDCGSPITGNAYCSNQNSVTLIAPGGFQDYLWFNPDFSKEFIDAQKYTISPPPPDGTKYAVVLFPFNGIGCVDTLYTVVNKIDANLIFKVADTVYGCVGTGIDLTAASVTAGSDNNLVFSYYDNASATGYLFEPKNILKSGTYYIQAVSPAGCINILPVNVVIANPSLIVHNPAPAVFPVTVDISSTFVHNNSYSYGYFTDSAATIPVDDYEHIAESGTYYIRAANPAGCTTTRHVNIVVVPPPPPVIKAPNTFTPNNDGINDYFFITVIGYGEFESLKIYNRYGQLVFETKSADNKWDGKYNGKPANPGTYYWVFDGANTYYHTKVTQSGFITLIR